MAAFHANFGVPLSRPAVQSHATPLAISRPEARPEARLTALAAALVLTFGSTTLQPAWAAGNFLQDALERKAAEIQANVQKTDFQDRFAKFQEDSANLADASKSAIETAKDGSALDGLAVNIDLSGARPLDLSGLNNLGEDSLGEAKRRIAKFQAAAELEKQKALDANAADVAKKQERAKEVAAQAAAAAADASASVGSSIASDEALQALTEDAALKSERTKAALAKAKETDLDAIQAQTKAALSEQFAAASSATADAASKTVAGVSQQLEMAKGGTQDYSKKAVSALGSVSLPTVAAPDLGSKVDEFRAKGEAGLAKAKEGSLQDSARMAKSFERAKENVGRSVADLAADNAVGTAVADTSAQAAAALQQVSSSVVEGVQDAVESKKVEVQSNIEKTDFQSRFAKAKRDAAEAKEKAAAAAAAAQEAAAAAQATLKAAQQQ
eukprot:CAMPEP_0119092546 /NCGR_PEP_ID=MMETSP1178-20130426/160115_1 /TAXON_ID=33656 /ORGANISM="unid sp, Strain CCMP2000" /LENGTH=441 /DNA_ID=CAMNT_0007076133 /DNA_START=15 /DNA_END=1340 /DNA_ORIENTATION=-